MVIPKIRVQLLWDQDHPITDVVATRWANRLLHRARVDVEVRDEHTVVRDSGAHEDPPPGIGEAGDRIYRKTSGGDFDPSPSEDTPTEREMVLEKGPGPFDFCIESCVM